MITDRAVHTAHKGLLNPHSSIIRINSKIGENLRRLPPEKSLCEVYPQSLKKAITLDKSAVFVYYFKRVNCAF